MVCARVRAAEGKRVGASERQRTSRRPEREACMGDMGNLWAKERGWSKMTCQTHSKSSPHLRLVKPCQANTQRPPNTRRATLVYEQQPNARARAYVHSHTRALAKVIEEASEKTAHQQLCLVRPCSFTFGGVVVVHVSINLETAEKEHGRRRGGG